jgi:hypothetical protein
VNTSLNTASFDGKSNFGFDWGETPGVNTVTLSGDVTLNGKNVAFKPLKMPLDVVRPELNYTIKAKTATSLYKQGSTYTIQYGLMGGNMDTNSGIYWKLSAPADGGLAVVQVLNSPSNYIYETSWLGGTMYSTLGTNTGATFPLLDGDPGDTTPFYGPSAQGDQGNPTDQGDTPAMPIPSGSSLFPTNWAQLYLNATDYVMWNGGGM